MTVDKDVYAPTSAVRVVTATSLFDGHDAAINVMRRMLTATGVEALTGSPRTPRHSAPPMSTVSR